MARINVRSIDIYNMNSTNTISSREYENNIIGINTRNDQKTREERMELAKKRKTWNTHGKISGERTENKEPVGTRLPLLLAHVLRKFIFFSFHCSGAICREQKEG